MTVVSLGIPNKHWAREWAKVQWTTPMPLPILGAYQQNLWEVARWARLITCAGDGGSYTQADWTRIPWHAPYQDWTPAHTEVMYVSLERWSELVCRPLHVPYKLWGFAEVPIVSREEANWLAVERWAAGIGACCTGGGGG